MKTVALQYGDGQTRWEATIDGRMVEIARQSRDDYGERVDTHEFTTARQAREFVAEEIDKLVAAGFYEVPPDAPVAPVAPTSPPPDSPPPVSASSHVNGLPELAPTTHHNAALLEQIRANPSDIDAYLVYADWWQERGEPRGHLIALQHAARTDPMLQVAANDLIERFPDHFLPTTETVVSCEWFMGFVETLSCYGDLLASLTHPSSAVLQQLDCDFEHFVAIADRVDLPCLRVLALSGVDAEHIGQLRLSPFPALRIAAFADMVDDEIPALLAHLARDRALPQLELLAIYADLVEEEEVQPIVDAFLALPEAATPRLRIELRDDLLNRSAEEALRHRFAVVSEVPPSSPLRNLEIEYGNDDGDDNDDDDEDEDFEIEDGDLLDRLCERCGTMATGNEGRCANCGGAVRIYDRDYGWQYEFDDDHLIEPGDEVCPHDAARDPSIDASGHTDDGVDTRWDAFKDDAFDMDDA